MKQEASGQILYLQFIPSSHRIYEDLETQLKAEYRPTAAGFQLSLTKLMSP